MWLKVGLLKNGAATPEIIVKNASMNQPCFYMQIEKWFKTRGPTGMLSCFSNFKMKRVQISENCGSGMWHATLHTVAVRTQATFTISHQWTDACCLHVVSIWVKYINEISIKGFMIAWGLELALGQLIWIRNEQNSGNHHSWKRECSMEVCVGFYHLCSVHHWIAWIVSLYHTLNKI